MFVRVGIAVTCSVAAFTLNHLKNNKREDKDEPSEVEYPNQDELHSEEFDHNDDIPDVVSKTPEEEIKRVYLSSSPRKSSAENVGGEEAGGYLLPELESFFTGGLRSPDNFPERDSSGPDTGLSPNLQFNGKRKCKLRVHDRECSKVLQRGNGQTHSEPPYSGHPCSVPLLETYEEAEGSLDTDCTSPQSGPLDDQTVFCKGEGTPGLKVKECLPGRKLDYLEVDANPVDHDVSESCVESKRSLGENFEGSDEACNETIIEMLRITVAELKEREIRLEGELLEYYGLQEREIECFEKKRILEEQAKTIETLKLHIENLEVHSNGLSSMIIQDNIVQKELAVARVKVRELQNQLQEASRQSKEEIMILKQQLSIMESRENEGSRREIELEKKLESLRELEVEVVELRRTSKDIQHQRRDLIIKLSAAESQISRLSNSDENALVTQAEEKADALRKANEDLCRQVEKLLNSRFCEVEELVYLRWVNACLRYELRNLQAPSKKHTALDLNKNLSPKSQSMAKQLMLEHAGHKSQLESGYESTSSESSVPHEPDGVGDLSDQSSELRLGRVSKKPSLIRRLKKWTGRKEDKKNDGGPRDSSSRGSSVDRDRRSPAFDSQSETESNGLLETVIVRNSEGASEISDYGSRDVGNDKAQTETSREEVLINTDTDAARLKLCLPPIHTKLADKELSGVAASFQLMSKSAIGSELDEKYPAFKDRHRAALEREKCIKEKAFLEREKHNKAKAANEREKLSTEKIAIEKEMFLKEQSEPKSEQRVTVTKYTSGNPILTHSSFLRMCDAESRPEVGIVAKRNVEVAKMCPTEVEKRPLRIAKPPPKRSLLSSINVSTPPLGRKVAGPLGPPPPPPPPPPLTPGALCPPPPPPTPGSLIKGSGAEKMQRAPGVVEFYQSLMKRDAKQSLSSPGGTVSNSEARNNIIGEIENRSTHLLAIKADVETQGEFVESLAAEVRAASFSNIEEVVEFVVWLDEELSFLGKISFSKASSTLQRNFIALLFGS
ncbi:protein CHUP1, chloroplastic isoform X2 [Physcomitrium patens]|uniref:protein CHUP1, chloroplastic isoform X2 n=1 Tax=Physcomitrium patens TaxID=3218 RepID=UPI003CCDBAFD